MLTPVFLYCARSGPGLFEEWLTLAAQPVFLLLAVAIWRLAAGDGRLRAFALAVALLSPGGLALHMWPNALTVGANLVVTLAVVLALFHAANRRLLRVSRGLAMVLGLLVLPFAALSLTLTAAAVGPASSLAFGALPILMLGYAAVLRPDQPRVARGLLAAALVFLGGIAVRALDQPLCGVWPHGTQFLWKLFAAATLYLLVRALVAARPGHPLAGAPGGG